MLNDDLTRKGPSNTHPTTPPWINRALKKLVGGVFAVFAIDSFVSVAQAAYALMPILNGVKGDHDLVTSVLAILITKFIMMIACGYTALGMMASADKG